MKTDDIFEAITDIDDKFIAEARPVGFNDDQPVVVYPAPKKQLWKTLVPIAACLAVLCAAGAFGAKFFTERLRSNPSESGSASFSQLSVVNQHVTRIDIPGDGSEVEFAMEEFPTFNFKASNKSVMSVLKTPPETDIVIENSIFNGKIHIDDLYLADLNGDGKREICASVYYEGKGHSIMVSDFADEFMVNAPVDEFEYNESAGILIVDKPTNGTLYTLLSDYMNFEYSLAEEDGVLKAVKTVWRIPSVSAAPKELSREPLTLDMMTRIVADLKNINVPVSLNEENIFVMEEFPGYDFTATHNSVLLNGYEMNSVDMPIISGDTLEDLYLCDLNGDGRRELCATVLNNGISSVEVVDIAKDKCYTLQGDRYNEYYLGRSGEVLMLNHAEQYGSDRLVSGIQLSLDMMTSILSNNATAVTKIDAEKKFKLAEFPDKTFEIMKHSIVMSDVTNPDAMIRPLTSTYADYKYYYLADLNGDGMREICCQGSIGSGIVSSCITVYDIANDEIYHIKGERPSDKWQSLDLKDGVLYAVTSDLNEDKEISREPLSLDILEKVTKSDTNFEEIPLYFAQMFTVDDLPGITFMVDTSYEYPMLRFGWGSESVSENVHRAFLYDLDGDGKREICLNCPFAGLGIIRVYGVMDNGESGCAEYYENGGCYLSGGEDGELLYYTNDKIEPFKFSKSDLKSSFARNYTCQLLGWDHYLDLGDIAPVLGTYDIAIKEGILEIKRNDEQIFDSGIRLQDLYSISDKENNSVILIYTIAYAVDDGGVVGAVRLSENSAERYDFEKGVTLKPTADELLIVNADGSETPFKFPENAEKISINN